MPVLTRCRDELRYTTAHEGLWAPLTIARMECYWGRKRKLRVSGGSI